MFHHLGQAAATLLLVYLLFFVTIFLAIAGGLAFGLWWVRGKTDWAFGKVNVHVPAVQQIAHTGTDYIAKPFIVAGKAAATVEGTAEAVRARVRRVRSSDGDGDSGEPSARLT
jgi:hypothetical protein